MAKNLYVENSDSAHCSECGFRCDPVCDDGSFSYTYGSIEGTHSEGEEWSSHCCSSSIVDEDDRPWEADVVEGCPEP
jgi:hypothetical protein